MTKLHRTLLILALFLTVIFTSAITTALLAPRAVVAMDTQSMFTMIGSQCCDIQNQVNKLKQRVSDIENKLKMEGGW